MLAAVLAVLLLLSQDADCTQVKKKVDDFLVQHNPFRNSKRVGYSAVEKTFGPPTSWKGQVLEYLYDDCSVRVTFSTSNQVSVVAFSPAGRRALAGRAHEAVTSLKQ